MIHTYDKRTSGCSGCGAPVPPWELKGRSVNNISGDFCADCRGDGIFTAADAPQFTFDDDAELQGVPYPVTTDDYDAGYEQQQFDLAEVNESVR